MRDVFETLDRLGIRYFVTGSVAASVHGVLRQTYDTDVVVDLAIAGFGPVAALLAPSYSIADPIDYGDFAMASIIDRTTADKVDLILQVPGAFEASAMSRRRRHDVPGLGPVWVASVEDIVIAKLRWSEGRSELQLRDCRQLLAIGGDAVDDAYLAGWARRLGLVELLRQVRDAT